MHHLKLVVALFAVALTLGCEVYCYLFVGGPCGCAPCRTTGRLVVDLAVGTSAEDAAALADAHGCTVAGDVLPPDEQTDETRPRLLCAEVCTERSDGEDEAGPAREALEEELADEEIVDEIRVESLEAC